MSTLLFNWKKAANYFYDGSKKSIFDNTQSSFIFVFAISCSLLGVGFSFLGLMINGWTLASILSDPLIISGQFAAIRGNAGVNYGFYGMLGTMFTYTTSVICGLIFNRIKRYSVRFFLVIIAFLPGGSMMVIQSSKLIFLISVCFFIGALLLSRLYANKNKIFSVKAVFNIGLTILLVTPFIFFSIISREHYGDLEPSALIANLTYAINSYIFGQIYAFSDFFSYYLEMPSKSKFYIDSDSYGAYTFYSVLNLFGFSKEFIPGLYIESGYVDGVFETNIFTIFRGVINDFGIIGSFVFFGLAGLVVNYTFYKMLYRRESIIRGLFFVGVFVAMVISYLVSVFMARYMYSTLFLTYIILKVYELLHSKRIRSKN